MKVFSSAQIRKWDAYTIENEPITSINLMERAATACFCWLIQNNFAGKQFRIFCGKGNNGGDGLALARLLIVNNCKVQVYILELGKPGTNDFQANLGRLHDVSTDIHFIQSADFFPALCEGDLVIDALLGTGLNKPLDGIFASLVAHINQSKALTISIDMPTGLFADASSIGNTIITATHTLSFQCYKLAFLLPENERYCGQVHLLDIKLHTGFEQAEPSDMMIIDMNLIRRIYKPALAFAHKGTFGHAALVCGSYGMMGAAILAAEACLRTGAGKLTSFIPRCGYEIMQTSLPEAMCVVAGDEHILSASGIEKFDSVGVGPGICIQDSHTQLLEEILMHSKKPIVLDADALNVLAAHKQLLDKNRPRSILTPHPKEFEQLFGKTANDFERIALAKKKALEHQVYIILKGHHSFIGTPGEQCFFNSSGNPGMATAGSGDVLTGVLTGLLARGYSSSDACVLGVFLHGLAGDLAAEKLSQEAMVAGDIVHYLGEAYKKIKRFQM